jgi:hypothetical protein
MNLNYLLFEIASGPQNYLHVYCDWLMFSSIYLSLAAVKMRQCLLVTGSFRYDLQYHRWLPVCIFTDKIAAVGPVKRVPEIIFQN